MPTSLALGLGLTARRRGGAAAPTLADRLAALLGPPASFWLPGPSYWFTDSAKVIPCDDTDLIRVWADASANGRDFLQGTSGSRPSASLVGAAWRAVTDGVDDGMSVASYSQAATGCTLGAVVALTADGSYPTMMSARPAYRDVRCEAGSRQVQLTVDEGGTGGSSAARTLDTPYRVVAAFGDTGQPSKLYIDGALIVTDAADTTTTLPNTISLATRGGLCWPGWYVAAVFVPATLTAQQVADLDALLQEVPV